MSPPRIQLRDMTQAEYDEYADERDREFAEASARTLPLEAAKQMARQGRARFLPQGLATERHRLLVAEDADGRVVGSVWLGLDEPRTGTSETAWLYDLRVEADRRREGFATAILEAVETIAREAGAVRLGLNVFGDNLPAVALYHSCGYRVTTQQMAKDL